MSFRVRENQPGAMVGQLIKRNQNKRFNETIAGLRTQKFVIVNQMDVQNKFAISQDGTIYTQQPLDREERMNYQLTVLAESGKRIIRNLYHVSTSTYLLEKNRKEKKRKKNHNVNRLWQKTNKSNFCTLKKISVVIFTI